MLNRDLENESNVIKLTLQTLYWGFEWYGVNEFVKCEVNHVLYEYNNWINDFGPLMQWQLTLPYDLLI